MSDFLAGLAAVALLLFLWAAAIFAIGVVVFALNLFGVL